MGIENVHVLDESCNVVDCGAPVRGALETQSGNWEGLCVRHLTITVLLSTAKSLDVEHA